MRASMRVARSDLAMRSLSWSAESARLWIMLSRNTSSESAIRRILVLLVALVDLGFECRRSTTAASNAAGCGSPQDAAADIEPDEQDRSDQRQQACAQHDMVASEIS